MDGEVIETGAGLPGASSLSVRRKRLRSPRVTPAQIDALLSILEARPYLHTRKFTGLQGRENFETGWREVAEELNNLPNGSRKTPEQWMTVWRDLKSRACSKAAKLKKEQKRTGNRGVSTAPLTEAESRIISIVGADYSFGTDCPDAMPEEDLLQHEMEAGVVISEVLTLPHSQARDFVELLPTETTINDSRATAGSSPPPIQEQVQDAPQSPVLQMIRGRRTETVASSTPPLRQRPRRKRNLNPRQSVSEQYSAARREFLAVAEANAATMKMLATAAQAQADAAKMQAEAAKVQAEATLQLVKVGNKIADAINNYINKNNK
nr:uncharacterized protein LOC126054603 isoform X2 [Helicoverpa armigera]